MIRLFSRVVILQFFLICAYLPGAFAATSGITYQGRILKPDGTPLSGATTQFKLQIRTPDSNSCLMYEEIQTQNLSGANGVFSLTINEDSSLRTDTSGFTPDRIFSNHGTFTFPSTNCLNGSGTVSYSPSSGDARTLAVLFKDETMSSWEPIPPAKINFVPFAFESKQVQGFAADSLLRVVSAGGDPLTGVSPLSNVQWTELQALIAGTSTQYTHAGQIAGSAAPSMTSGQVLGWNGSAWTSVDPLSTLPAFAKTALPACAAGEYLRNSAGALVCSTPASGAGGTVTQVNTGTGLTGGGFTTTGTISIAAGGVGSTELAALSVTSAKIALQAVDTAQLKDGAVTTVKLADGNVTTVKLADANVTLVKLAADSVDSSKIADGSIVGADLNPAINITTSGTVASGVSTTRDFKLYPSSGSFKINFAAPTLAADYSLTFPADDGAPSQVLTTDGNGNLTWTTPAGTGISALTGDVTASGSGSVVATVAAVGGSTAVSVHTAELAANAATSVNTASTIVKRDASGNFAAGVVTSSSTVTSTVVLKDTGSNTVTLQAPTSVGTSYVLKMPTAVAPSTQLLQSDSTGQLSYVAMPTALPPNGAAGGDLSGTYPNPAVATVGTSTAANLHSGELLANAATSANTNSAIVRRDSSGNFVSNVGTFNDVTLNNGGSLLNILNPIGGAWTMTLPATAGSTGQIMQTNGAGVMTWVTPLSSTTGFVNGGNSFGANSALGNNDNFDLNIKTNNATRMTVTASGSVGIGTTGPTQALDVAGSVNSSGGFYATYGNPHIAVGNGSSATGFSAIALGDGASAVGGGSVALGFTANGGGSRSAALGPGSSVSANYSTAVGFGSKVTGDYSLAMNGANAVNTVSGTNSVGIFFGSASGIDVSNTNTLSMMGGNVGVGTTAPATKLQVNGSMLIGDGGETCGATYAGAVRYNGGNLQFCNGTPPWSTLGVAGSGVSSLTGDVTASGPGAAAATVVQVGGYSAANIAAGATLANAATNANTASALVKRDASGNFAAGTISAGSNVTNSVVYKDSGSSSVTLSAPTTLSSSYALKWPTAAAGAASILQSDTSGNLSWVTGVAPTGAAGGDLSGTYPNPSVANVGTSTAAQVHSAELAANAATSTNTASTLVKRDASGNFAAGTGTFNGVTLNNGGSLLNIVNPVGGAWTMTLPATAGSSGQVLTTNGAGILSWAPTAISSQWTTHGANISYDGGGNVGIGTTSPVSVFHIAASAPVMTIESTSTGATSTAAINFQNDSAGAFPGSIASSWGQSGMVFTSPRDIAGQSGFHFNSNGGTERFTIDTGNGNVGIGTTLPNSALEVVASVGSTYGPSSVPFGTNLLVKNTYGGTTGVAGITLNPVGTASAPVWIVAHRNGVSAYSDTVFGGRNSGGTYQENLRITKDGAIGIGTTSPTTKLDVWGDIRTNSTLILGESSAINRGIIGFVTSGNSIINGSNYGELALRNTGSIIISATNGASPTMYLKQDNNVGIGTTSPEAKLEINGTIKIGGAGTETCDATHYIGGIRYNAGNVQFCDSASWKTLGVAGSGVTSLTGDVTGTGPGATATTVVQVGGYSSTNVAAGATLANAATNANTASTIVKRDASGNFSAGTGSFTSLTSSGSISTGTGAKIATLSPSAISTSYTWTLPSAVASSNGQMLTSDTSGNLSWVTPAAGSQWTTQAPGINYMGGNVGIGTTSPRGALEIDGADGTMYVRNTNSSGYAGMNMFDDTNTLTGSFQIGGSAASVGAGSLFIGPRKAGGNLMFVRGVGATESARIDSNGRFGIGTSSPVGAMDVSTASGTTEFNLRSAGLNHGMTGVVSSTDIGLQLSTSSNGGGFLGGFSNFQNTSGLSFFAVSNAPNAGIPAIEFRAYKKSGVGIAPLDPGDTAMKLSSGPSTLMTVMGSGNVGIGTTMPNSKLEVGGTIISTPNVTASGATLDMSKSNLQTITSATSSAITLNNLVNGGNYTIVIKDATSRTYTFPGCTTQKFLPANTATTASSWSMYTILSLDNGGGGFDCMITWATGYQ